MDNDGTKFLGESSLVELHILASDIGEVGWDCAIVRNEERKREREEKGIGKKNSCCNRSNRIIPLFSRVTAFTEFVLQNAAKWMGWFWIDALTRASDGHFTHFTSKSDAVIFKNVVMLNHYAGKLFHSELLTNSTRIHLVDLRFTQLATFCWALFTIFLIWAWYKSSIWHKVIGLIST